jgi:hypothetical protein
MVEMGTRRVWYITEGCRGSEKNSSAQNISHHPIYIYIHAFNNTHFKH